MLRVSICRGPNAFATRSSPGAVISPRKSHMLRRAVDARSAAGEPVARRIARWLMFVIAVLSFGNFNPELWGGGNSNPAQLDQSVPSQTYVVVALWMILLGCTFLPRVLRKPLSSNGIFLPIFLLCYILASLFWGHLTFDAVSKGLVLATISFAVWRMTAIISVDEFLSITALSVLILSVVSGILLVVYPQAAIAHEWQHEGDWQGIFGQKQELGIVAAFLVFFALMRTLHRKSWWDFFTFLYGLVFLIASGSRGAAIIGCLGPFLILLTRKSPKFLRALVWIIAIDIGLAAAGMIYLLRTGDEVIYLGDTALDFSQRSMIWSYALDLWQGHPWLGYGINSFWTDPQILWGFLRTHGWVLDNYHDGYLAILVETGLVGMVLFLLLVTQVCVLLRGSRKTMSRETTEMCFGFLIMLFTINLTETIFLRSTNFGEVAFTFLALSILSTRAATQRLPWSLTMQEAGYGKRHSRSPREWGVARGHVSSRFASHWNQRLPELRNANNMN